MTNGSLRLQRTKDICFRYALTVLRWIIEPSAIVDEKQRRRVRVLSAFLLLFAINTLIGAMAVKNAGNSSWFIFLATAAILLVGYVLNRTRYYRLAVVLAVSIPAVPVLAMILFSANRANIPNELPWLALPLLISTLLLSLRSTIIIAISYIIIFVILTSFADVPATNLSQSLSFMFMIFFFVLAIAATRQKDQSEIEHELTERKQAEQALKESEEFSTSLLQNSPTPIVVLNPDTSIEYANPAFEKLTSFTLAEIAGKKAPYPWWPEESKKEIGIALKEDMAGSTKKSRERIWRKKNGELFWAVLSSVPVIHDGKLKYFLVNWFDITKRKQIEERLQESEEFAVRKLKFETAISTISSRFVGLTNIDDAINKSLADIGKLSNASRSYLFILHEDGIHADNTHEWCAEGVSAGISLNQNAPTDKMWWARAQPGEVIQVEDVSRMVKDADLRAIMEAQGTKSILISPVYNSKGCVFGFMGVENVVSTGGWSDTAFTILRMSSEIIGNAIERKQAEEKLKQALANLEHSNIQLTAINKELEAFSYSVSHDLRAPLRTIDGFSQALMEDYQDKLDEQGKDYLSRLRAASQRMGGLIDELLKLSRLSRSEMRKEPVDLSALAQEIAAELQQTQPERQVEFVISEGLATVGDRQLLRVALGNLLGNAWKFTSKRQQARIEFSITQNGDKKAYFVRDNGAGFDMTYAKKLFGAFQRLHDTTEFPGTGIGLATVQRIIHRHGGSVWAEGTMGKGATFYFTLS